MFLADNHVGRFHHVNLLRIPLPRPNSTAKQITYQETANVSWQDAEEDQCQEEEGDPKTRR
jgi:hypothetical protein